MTRQEAYVAELSQLLFYMTPWDKAEALKNVNKLFAEAENEVELMDELGSPMKLAVTLHRSYEPTPEPTPEELAARAAAEAAEAAETEEVVEAEAAETEEGVEAEAVETEEGVEAEAVETEEVVEAEAVETEDVVEAEAVETVEIVEPAQTAWIIEDDPKQEKIFAEIFNAATEAQSAVVIEEAPKKETKRKARYLFLIPYTILALIVGIPGTLIFAVANLAVAAVAVASLVMMIYLVIFHLFAAVTLGSKLILLGLAIVMLSLTVIMGLFAWWFLHTATLGFPHFLLEIARKHGYREVEVQ